MSTLILVPGLMCDAAVWAHQVHALGGTAQVTVPDHGLADSIGAMAARILERAPDRFALAGHSMGGRVALEIVRRAPARVAALALLDTHYRGLPEGGAGRLETEGRRALVELAHRAGMRAVGERWLKIPMVHPSRLADATLTGEILAMIERRTPEQFEAQVRALITRPDAASVLGAIRCHTLVLCGAQDAWARPEGHREMAALIPGSTLVSIPVCGHMAPLERPAEVSAALAAWLREGK